MTEEKEVKQDEKKAEAAPAEEKTSGVETAPLKGLVGHKIGMTSVFISANEQVAVTVIQSSGAIVTQVKLKETDGYNAVQVGCEELPDKKANKAQAGHFKKKNIPLKRWLHEFPVQDAAPFKPGQSVPVTVFQKGDWVEVMGINKGKGFSGVMKRHNFGGLPHSHGHGEYRRSPGSSGGQQPQRVIPGTRKPGHYGHVRNTVPKIQIVDIDAEQNLILVSGSIPGPNGNRVVIRPTKKKIPLPQNKQGTKKKK